MSHLPNGTVLGLLALVFVVGCTSYTKQTYEYDPVAVQVGNYWAGVFWVCIAVGTALAVIAWAIAYAISEHAKYSRRDPSKDRS